ncbi:MAG: hypothetical protein OXJ52_09135, partial [Oligoflexia bacterium]|nr:hypothetical protein [Oligoflexia bacterium]
MNKLLLFIIFSPCLFAESNSPSETILSDIVLEESFETEDNFISSFEEKLPDGEDNVASGSEEKLEGRDNVASSSEEEALREISSKKIKKSGIKRDRSFKLPTSKRMRAKKKVKKLNLKTVEPPSSQVYYSQDSDEA